MTVESLLDLAKTIGAFILLVLVILVAWLVVSPIAYALRFCLIALRLPSGMNRLAAWLITVTPAHMWQLGASLLTVESRGSSGELRLVIDNRLATLERAIGDFSDATRKAAASLVGLGSSRGPSGLAHQVSSLRADIESLGNGESSYDISEEDLAATAEEKTSRSTRLFLSFAAIAIVVINGGLLSEAFRSWGMTATIAGFVKVYIGFAVMYVVIEILVGLLLHISVVSRNYPFAVLVTLASLALVGFEIYVMDQIGLGRFDTVAATGVSAFEQHAFGLIGLALGIVNCGVGYFLHQFHHRVTHLSSRRSVVRDAAAWNRLLVDLPERLDSIRNNISGAQGSLDTYLISVGGHSDALGSSVDAVSQQREAVLVALREADVRNWPQWTGADTGDAVVNQWLSVAAALGTLVLGYLLSRALANEVQSVFPSSSEALIWGGSIGATMALYLAGFAFLSQIQLLELPGARTVPLRRSGDFERILTAIGILAAVIAIWGFSIYAHGWRGIPAGALITLLAAAMVALGALWDRFVKGIFGGGIALTQFLLSVLMLLGGAALHVIGWLLIAIGKVVMGLLGFVAFPLDWILQQLEKRRASRQPVCA